MLENYEKMNQTQKNSFSSVANRLLATTFLSRDKRDNKEDYYFLVSYKDLFEEFFAVLGYELSVDTTVGSAMIIGGSSLSTLKLKRDETIILLILRILYYENMKNTSLSDNVSCEVTEILEKYDYLQVKKKLPKTELIRDLRLFKRYNLIETIGDINSSKVKVIILPTILMAINIDDVDMLNNEIKTLVMDDTEVSE